MHDDSPDNTLENLPSATICGYRREDLEEIKKYLPAYCNELGIFLYPSGENLAGLCPIHDDTRPSFSVFGADHIRWKCFACDSGGDVFDLSIALGRSKNLADSVLEVTRSVGLQPPRRQAGGFTKRPRARGASKPTRPYVEPELTEEAKAHILLARLELRETYRKNRRVVEKLADELGIPVEVLMKAARGASGLGLVDGKLAYVYPKGIKIRNRPGSSIRFIWDCGRAYAPWRFERVTEEITTIYLTEGESDALAIIASGLESDGKSVAVASPGVSFPGSWAPLFAKKHVVICFDFDTAGQKAAEKVARLLEGHARAVMVVKPKI